MRVDLHAHTTASDGTLRPAELVRQAREVGLAATGGSDYHGRGSVRPERRLGTVLAPPGALDGLRRAQQ